MLLNCVSFLFGDNAKKTFFNTNEFDGYLLTYWGRYPPVICKIERVINNILPHRRELEIWNALLNVENILWLVFMLIFRTDFIQISYQSGQNYTNISPHIILFLRPRSSSSSSSSSVLFISLLKSFFNFFKVDTARVMLRSSEPDKDYINASFVDVSTYVLGALTLYRPRSNS